MNTKAISPAPVAPGPPDKKEVARVACELWKRYGCPAGRDEMIWLEAERLVARGGAGQGPPARNAPAKEEHGARSS